MEKEPKKYYFSQINLVLIVLQTGIIFLRKEALAEKVPLFYSRPWGDEQLVPAQMLFLIPLLALAFLALGQMIKKAAKDQDFIGWISSGFSLLFSLLGSITLLRIIFLLS